MGKNNTKQEGTKSENSDSSVCMSICVCVYVVYE